MTGGNLGVVAGSGEPASATSAAVSIANGSREGGFCVKLTTSAGGGTAEGFATSTITATPQLAYTSGGGGNHPSTSISLTPDSARHIRLDDDNNFTIAEPTATVSGISSTNGATKNFNAYQVVEGETLNLTLAGGASVTAPTGENYGVQVGTTFTGETPLPQAIGSGQDYGASLTTTTATTLAPAGTVSVPIDSATGGDNTNGDAFINGNRYALLGSLLITPANRGASTTATSATVHAAQTPRIVEIQDDDSANIAPSLTAGYPRSGSGATAAERATQQFNSGAKVAENATATHDFNILLTKAHRAQDVRTTTATGVAPLVIELEPIGTIPAGFSGFDYSVAIGSATAGVSVAYSPAGNGVTTISVKRQNTNEDSVSVTSIPLKLTLKPDDDVEGGGVVNFGITGLGHLQCSTLVEPATVQEGCYHAGAVAHTDGRARFQLSMDLADEGGALTISETDGNTDGLIEITENASANNGFGLVFSRLPEGGLADRTGGYTANINSYVSVEDVHSDLNANDFKPPLQIDYDGGVDELVDLTGINISNIKGFGGASSTTGLSLKFAETGGASAGASVNTLFFAVENDDIVEEDETFTLVIDPGPTGVATIPLGVADVNAKITGKTSIAVTIKSEDAITVSGDTTTAIREGGNGRTLAKGQYKLDFTGAEYPRAQRLNVVFTQTTDGGSPTQLTTGSSGQVSLAAATTSGVTLNSSGVLALPANVDDIDVVFDVGLKTSASASDSGVTAVQMVLDAPTLGTTADSSLDASSQAGKYVADIGVVDSDQQTYEVKFEVNDANVATVQENGNTDIPVKIHLVPMGSASGFPAGTADLNDVTSGVQGLVFELTLTKDGTALADQGFTAGKKDSTWNATKGRYEWDLTIAGNNTAEANRLFAASVRTKTDWSSADFSHLTDGSYRPISNDAEEAEFTVYDDDNTVSFNSATPASVDAGSEEGADGALVKVNSEFVANQDAVVLGADVGSDAPEYLISFAVSSPDGADPLEYGGTKDYTITAVDSSKVADATRQGNFKLASDGTIGNAVLLATGAGQDEIIEDTEGVKITLTGVEPANRGLKLSDDADDNSRIFLFADATADGVSILSLSATAPEANHFTNTGDQRNAAEKQITGVVEGVDVPVYIHLSKPTEKEQSFVLKHCCGQKEEYDFGGVETNSGRTIFSIPASVAGTKVGSTLITMTVDDEAESSQSHDFEISKLGDSGEGITTPASDFPIQDSEKSIKIVTADEAGELVITNKDVRIAEGIDTLTLTIRRQGALNAAGDAIGARLTFAYGTVEGQPAATQGTGATRDYTEDTKNKDVVFTQVGSNEYQEVTVDLDLRVFNGADDAGDGVEGPEFFTVKIATATRRGATSTVPGVVTIANTNTVPVQIVDSETAIVSFAEDEVTFKEGQENAIVKVNVSPTRRLNRVSLDLTVGEATDRAEELQATAGDDYTTITGDQTEESGIITIEIPPSRNSATAAEIDVPIKLLDDNLIEATDEYFTVSLPIALPSGFGPLLDDSDNRVRQSVEVAIRDDDNAANFPTPETDAKAQIVVVTEPDNGASPVADRVLSIPVTVGAASATEGTIGFELVTDEDTLTLLKIGGETTPLATANTDFTLPATTATLAANAVTAQVMVNIKHDENWERPEFLALQLTSAPGGVGANKYVIVRIEDNDRIKLLVTNPKPAAEEGALNAAGNPIGNRNGEIIVNLQIAEESEGLPASYRVDIKAEPESNTKFTFNPAQLHWRKGDKGPRKVRVIPAAGEIATGDAKFSVSEPVSNGIYNDIVDVVDGTADIDGGDQTAAKRVFTLNYIDADAYTPLIAEVRSSTGTEATIDPSGIRVEIPESFIPRGDGLFIISLNEPDLDAATSNNAFATELAKTGSAGGQVNFAAVVNDGSATLGYNRLTTGSGADAVYKSGVAIFPGKTNGQEVVGFWKNADASENSGQVGGGDTVQIQMPNQSYWRDNDTIEGNREFTVTLTPKAYARADTGETLNHATATALADGLANVAASTTWTFVIIDDDVNPPKIKDRAQVAFQHYTLFEQSSVARASFADVPTTGSWVDGLPAEVEKGTRLWLRLKSSLAFGAHLTVDNATTTERIKFAAAPDGKGSFLTAELGGIEWGFQRLPTDSQDDQFSVPQAIEIPVAMDEDGNTIVTGAQVGGARLRFESDISVVVPTKEELQANAVTLKQPAKNSVKLVDASSTAFSPTFEPLDASPLYEDIPAPAKDNLGKGRLVALKPGSTLAKDQTAVITFATAPGHLKVVEPTGLDSNLVTITKGTGQDYTLVFKRGLTVPSSGAVPDEAQPEFSYQFVASAGSDTARDPDGASGTPVVTVSVEVDGVTTTHPIPVVDSENPIFGWVSQAQGNNIFESDIETLFPSFSVGRTTTEAVTVALTIEVTASAGDANQGVLHSVLTAGGWVVGTPVTSGMVPYSKNVTIAAGTTGALGRGSATGELNIPIVNDAQTSPNGQYQLKFKQPVVTGNKPRQTNLSRDFTVTVFDDDRLYSFLKPNANREEQATDGVGRWGSALSDETAENPTLKSSINGLLEVEALASHEGAVNGKIYGYLEGAQHVASVYVSDGRIPNGGSFSIADLLTADLWSEDPPDGVFGSGDAASCNVFATRNSETSDIALGSFSINTSDDGGGVSGADNDVPSDHLPYRVVGRGATDSFTVTCAGKEYHLRPADGQPKVLYRLNDDVRVYYQFTQTVADAVVPVKGTNNRVLVYTDRAGDFNNANKGRALDNPTGEGPFYKVEIKLVDDKPVGYPVTVSFRGQGAPPDVADMPDTLNAAFGYNPPASKSVNLLWIRSATPPSSELAATGSPTRNSQSRSVVAEYDTFVDSPFHIPAGAVVQSPTSRDASNGAIAGFANDLYLAMARDLDEGSVIRPFDRVRVIPTRGRTGDAQFSTDSARGVGAVVSLETERRLVENLQVSWSDATTAFIAASTAPFVEGLAAAGAALRPTLEFAGLPIKAAAGVTEGGGFPFCLRVGNHKEMEIDRANASNKGFMLTAAQITAASASALTGAIQSSEATQANACIVATDGQGAGAWWSPNVHINASGVATVTVAGTTAHQVGTLVFKLKDDGEGNTSRNFGKTPSLVARDGAGDPITLNSSPESRIQHARDAGWKGKRVGVTLLPYSADGNFLTGLGLRVPNLRINVLEDDAIVRFNASRLAGGGPEVTLDAFNTGYGGDNWTQEVFDASPYSELRGIIERSGELHLRHMFELANFVDRGGARNANGFFPIDAGASSPTAANVMQRIANAFAPSENTITVVQPTGTPAPTTAAAAFADSAVTVVPPPTGVRAFNDTVFTSPASPRTMTITVSKPTAVEGIVFDGDGFGVAHTINVIDPNAPTFSATKGARSTEVQRDATVEGNGKADFDINENAAGAEYSPEPKLNVVGDDRLLGGQNIIFDPLYDGDTTTHPDQTASRSDYGFSGTAAFNRFWVQGANSGTQYGFDFGSSSANSITGTGPLNVVAKEDAAFEDVESVIASYEAAGDYTGYIGDPLIEGGEALTDANGKVRRGMTFRMFITDDETLTFRFKDSAPGTPPTVTEGVPFADGDQPKVVFTCSSPSGDNASPNTGAGENANTCTEMETSATTGAKLTMDLEAGDYYSLAVGDLEAEEGETEMVVSAGTVSQASTEVVLNLQKPANLLVEDFDSDNQSPPTYTKALTLTLSKLDDDAGGVRTSTTGTTSDETTRTFSLKDEEEDQTYDFSVKKKDLGEKNEGEEIYRPKIQISNKKETDKPITPEVRIVDTNGQVLTGWDWREVAGLTINAGENSATATEVIMVAADNTLRANPGAANYTIEMRDNVDDNDPSALDATKTFARIPRNTAVDNPSFILLDQDKAQASLKVALIRAGTINLATATAIPNSDYGFSALGAPDTESGFGFLFKLRIADQDTYADDGAPNYDGATKIIDGELTFDVVIKRTSTVGSYVSREDFGTPALVSASGDGTIGWHGKETNLRGTLAQGKSELLFFLPVADDALIEDIEDMTATLDLRKGTNADSGLPNWPTLNEAKKGHARVNLRIDSEDKLNIQFTAAAADLSVAENRGEPLGNRNNGAGTARKVALTLPADNLFLKQPTNKVGETTAYNLHFAYKMEPDASTPGATDEDFKRGTQGAPDFRDGTVFYTSLDGQGMGYRGTASSDDRGSFYNLGGTARAPTTVAWANAKDGFEFTENFKLTLVGLYLADETGNDRARFTDELDLDDHVGYQADTDATDDVATPTTIDELYSTSLWGGDITLSTADNSQPAASGGTRAAITTYTDDEIPIFLKEKDFDTRPRITLAADKGVVKEAGTDEERTITYSLLPSAPMPNDQTYTMVFRGRGDANTNNNLLGNSAEFPADIVVVKAGPNDPSTNAPTEVESTNASDLVFSFGKGATRAQTIKVRFKDRSALTTCRPRAIVASLSPRPALVDGEGADTGYDYDTPVNPVRDAFIQYLDEESLFTAADPRTETTLSEVKGPFPQYNPLVITNTVCADKFVKTDDDNSFGSTADNPEIPTTGLEVARNDELDVVHLSLADPNNDYQGRTILRIRFDDTVDDGDGNAATLQGLTATERETVLASFSVTSDTNNVIQADLETKTRQYYATVINYANSVLSITATDKNAETKRFKVDLYGPFESTHSHPWFKETYAEVPLNGSNISLTNRIVRDFPNNNVLTRTYDLLVNPSVSGRFRKYDQNAGTVSKFALRGESIDVVRGGKWEGLFDEQPFLADGASYDSGNFGASTQNAAVSHTVRVSLKDGHGLTAEQVAQVFQGPGIIRGFTHFIPGRQSDIVKFATHQARVSRTDNTIEFQTHEFPKYMEGKTLLVEVMGPYDVSNSPSQAPESTEFVGATGYGSGGRLMQSFEINITPAPITGTIAKADGVAIPEGSTLDLAYNDNLDLKFDNVGDTANTGHALRIAFDPSIDDGDDDDATIQGLTATQRKAVFNALEASLAFDTNVNSDMVAFHLISDVASFAFPNSSIPVVDKTLVFELLGEYDISQSPISVTSGTTGFGGVVVLQTFKVRIGKTPQSGKFQTDDTTPADITEGSTIEIAHDDLTQTFNFVDIANNDFVHFVRLTLDPSVADGDSDDTTIQGLTAAQREKIFEDDSSKITWTVGGTAETPYHSGHSGIVVADDGEVAFTFNEARLVQEKTFLVEVLGPYTDDSATSGPLLYTEATGTGTGAVMHSFKVKVLPPPPALYVDDSLTEKPDGKTIPIGFNDALDFVWDDRDGDTNINYAIRVALAGDGAQGLSSNQIDRIFATGSNAMEIQQGGTKVGAGVATGSGNPSYYSANLTASADPLSIIIKSGHAQGKTFKVEIVGPFRGTPASSVLNPDPANTLPQGTTVRQTFDLVVDKQVRLALGDGTSLLDEATVEAGVGAGNKLTLRLYDGDGDANSDHFIRIRLDPSVEDADNDNNTVQGLNIAARTALYDPFNSGIFVDEAGGGSFSTGKGTEHISTLFTGITTFKSLEVTFPTAARTKSFIVELLGPVTGPRSRRTAALAVATGANTGGAVLQTLKVDVAVPKPLGDRDATISIRNHQRDAANTRTITVSVEDGTEIASRYAEHAGVEWQISETGNAVSGNTIHHVLRFKLDTASKAGLTAEQINAIYANFGFNSSVTGTKIEKDATHASLLIPASGGYYFLPDDPTLWAGKTFDVEVLGDYATATKAHLGSEGYGEGRLLGTFKWTYGSPVPPTFSFSGTEASPAATVQVARGSNIPVTYAYTGNSGLFHAVRIKLDGNQGLNAAQRGNIFSGSSALALTPGTSSNISDVANTASHLGFVLTGASDATTTANNLIFGHANAEGVRFNFEIFGPFGSKAGATAISAAANSADIPLETLKIGVARPDAQIYSRVKGDKFNKALTATDTLEVQRNRALPLSFVDKATPAATHHFIRFSLDTGQDAGLSIAQQREIFNPQNYDLYNGDTEIGVNVGTDGPTRTSFVHSMGASIDDLRVVVRSPLAVGRTFKVELAGPYTSATTAQIAAITSKTSGTIIQTFKMTVGRNLPNARLANFDSNTNTPVELGAGKRFTASLNTQLDLFYLDVDDDQPNADIGYPGNAYFYRLKFKGTPDSGGMLQGLTLAQRRTALSTSKLIIGEDSGDHTQGFASTSGEAYRASDAFFSSSSILLIFSDANAAGKVFEIEVVGPYTGSTGSGVEAKVNADRATGINAGTTVFSADIGVDVKNVGLHSADDKEFTSDQTITLAPSVEQQLKWYDSDGDATKNYVVRYRLDPTVDDGDSTAGTIQGLDSAARIALYGKLAMASGTAGSSTAITGAPSPAADTHASFIMPDADASVTVTLPSEALGKVLVVDVLAGTKGSEPTSVAVAGDIIQTFKVRAVSPARFLDADGEEIADGGAIYGNTGGSNPFQFKTDIGDGNYYAVRLYDEEDEVQFFSGSLVATPSWGLSAGSQGKYFGYNASNGSQDMSIAFIAGFYSGTFYKVEMIGPYDSAALANAARFTANPPIVTSFRIGASVPYRAEIEGICWGPNGGTICRDYDPNSNDATKKGPKIGEALFAKIKLDRPFPVGTAEAARELAFKTAINGGGLDLLDKIVLSVGETEQTVKLTDGTFSAGVLGRRVRVAVDKRNDTEVAPAKGEEEGVIQDLPLVVTVRQTALFAVNVGYPNGKPPTTYEFSRSRGTSAQGVPAEMVLAVHGDTRGDFLGNRGNSKEALTMVLGDTQGGPEATAASQQIGAVAYRLADGQPGAPDLSGGLQELIQWDGITGKGIVHGKASGRRNELVYVNFDNTAGNRLKFFVSFSGSGAGRIDIRQLPAAGVARGNPANHHPTEGKNVFSVFIKGASNRPVGISDKDLADAPHKATLERICWGPQGGSGCHINQGRGPRAGDGLFAHVVLNKPYAAGTAVVDRLIRINSEMNEGVVPAGIGAAYGTQASFSYATTVHDYIVPLGTTEIYFKLSHSALGAENLGKAVKAEIINNTNIKTKPEDDANIGKTEVFQPLYIPVDIASDGAVTFPNGAPANVLVRKGTDVGTELYFDVNSQAPDDDIGVTRFVVSGIRGSTEVGRLAEFKLQNRDGSSPTPIASADVVAGLNQIVGPQRGQAIHINHGGAAGQRNRKFSVDFSDTTFGKFDVFIGFYKAPNLRDIGTYPGASIGKFTQAVDENALKAFKVSVGGASNKPVGLSGQALTDFNDISKTPVTATIGKVCWGPPGRTHCPSDQGRGPKPTDAVYAQVILNKPFPASVAAKDRLAFITLNVNKQTLKSNQGVGAAWAAQHSTTGTDDRDYLLPTGVTEVYFQLTPAIGVNNLGKYAKIVFEDLTPQFVASNAAWQPRVRLTHGARVGKQVHLLPLSIVADVGYANNKAVVNFPNGKPTELLYRRVNDTPGGNAPSGEQLGREYFYLAFDVRSTVSSRARVTALSRMLVNTPGGADGTVGGLFRNVTLFPDNPSNRKVSPVDQFRSQRAMGLLVNHGKIGGLQNNGKYAVDLTNFIGDAIFWVGFTAGDFNQSISTHPYRGFYLEAVDQPELKSFKMCFTILNPVCPVGGR